MNKKFVIISFLAVFIIVAISYASAVDTNIKNVDKKESPLYRIRTRRAITEKIGTILENIKTKFLGERLIFIPFIWLEEIPRYANFKDCTCINTGCTYGPTNCMECASVKICTNF